MREIISFRLIAKIVCVFVFLALQIPLISPAAVIPSPDIIGAAQEGIRTLLKESGEQTLNQFGLSGRQEAAASSLGEGFQVFAVRADSLLKNLQDISTLAVPTSLWQFLVWKGGRAIALLTVDRMNDQWLAVSIGASGLANQLKRMREAWLAAEGYEFKLIKIYAAKSDFIEVSQGGKAIGLVPMISARMALGLPSQDLDPRDFHSSEEIIEKIKPVVGNAIR